MSVSPDPDTVIDTKFQVRGVDGLRVVDMSSWHNVPGFFVITTMYMVSICSALERLIANLTCSLLNALLKPSLQMLGHCKTPLIP